MLQDLDAHVALCAFVGSSVKDGMASVKMKDGAIQTALLSGDFQGVVDWKGKCLDLEKAYRQAPVSSRHCLENLFVCSNAAWASPGRFALQSAKPKKLPECTMGD